MKQYLPVLLDLQERCCRLLLLSLLCYCFTYLCQHVSKDAAMSSMQTTTHVLAANVCTQYWKHFYVTGGSLICAKLILLSGELHLWDNTCGSTLLLSLEQTCKGTCILHNSLSVCTSYSSSSVSQLSAHWDVRMTCKDSKCSRDNSPFGSAVNSAIQDIFLRRSSQVHSSQAQLGRQSILCSI